MIASRLVIFDGMSTTAPSSHAPGGTAALARAFAAGRAEWPDVPLPAQAFADHVAALGVAAENLLLHGADLYLACACTLGLPTAVKTFEQRLFPTVERQIARRDWPRAGPRMSRPRFACGARADCPPANPSDEEILRYRLELPCVGPWELHPTTSAAHISSPPNTGCPVEDRPAAFRRPREPEGRGVGTLAKPRVDLSAPMQPPSRGSQTLLESESRSDLGPVPTCVKLKPATP
jgi:hypothetical protein